METRPRESGVRLPARESFLHYLFAGSIQANIRRNTGYLYTIPFTAGHPRFALRQGKQDKRRV